MVDTMKFRNHQFTVSPTCPLRINDEDIDDVAEGRCRNRFLYQDEQGARFSGRNALINTPSCRIEIVPTRALPRSGQSQGDMIVNLTAPAVDRCHNFFPLSASEFREALQIAEREMHEVGITVDMMTGRLSRLDLFRNITLNEPCVDYKFLFNRLDCKRMLAHHHPTGISFLWRNGQHQVALYDKRAELMKHRRNMTGIPANVIRLEYRMMCARKVRAASGMATVGELVERYDALPTIMARQIQRVLHFSPGTGLESHELSTIANNASGPFDSHDVVSADVLNCDGTFINGVAELTERMQQFQSDGRGSWRRRFFYSAGLTNWVERVGVEGVLQAQDEVTGRCRKRRSELKREIEEACSIQSHSEVETPLTRRFRELQEKLFDTDLDQNI